MIVGLELFCQNCIKDIPVSGEMAPAVKSELGCLGMGLRKEKAMK